MKIFWKCAGLLFFALLFSTAAFSRFEAIQKQAPGIDELIHILAGYSHLSGDRKLNFEHPPFFKMLAALPLKWRGVQLPAYDKSLQTVAPLEIFPTNISFDPEFSRKFFQENVIPQQEIIATARLVPFWLSLIFGIVLFAFGYFVWGYCEGLLASCFWLFSPLLSAHSQFVMTDVPVTILAASAFMSLYLAFSGKRKILWGILSILLLGLTCVTKFSGIIFVPCFAALTLFYFWIFSAVKKGRWKKALLWTVFAAVAIFLIILWNYNFHFGTIGDDIVFRDILQKLNGVQPTSLLAKILNFWNERNFLLPSPGYIKGLTFVALHNSIGHTSSFLGSTPPAAVWYYFPLGLILKSTVAETMLLGLILFGIPFSFHKIRSKSAALFSLLIFALPAAAFLTISMLGNINLGVRHIFPIIPLLFLLGAFFFSQIPKPWKQIGIFLLIFLQIWSFWRIKPFFMTHMNELVDIPEHTYLYLGDSNFDFGQNFYYLVDFLKANPDCQGRKIYALHWSVLSLRDYGLDAEMLPKKPVTGCIVLANFVRTTEVFKDYRWIEDYKRDYLVANTYDVFILKNLKSNF